MTDVMTDEKLVERRVPVPIYVRKVDDCQPLDEEGLKWLADQLCSEDRVHEKRTMSAGWIPEQAAYEFPNLIDRIQSLTADLERAKEALGRQTDNMAFLLNRIDVPDEWYIKFSRRLTEDILTLKDISHD